MAEDTFGRRTLLVIAGGAATAGLASSCALLRGGASHPELVPPASAIGQGTVRVPVAEVSKLSPSEALLVKMPQPQHEVLIAPLGDGSYAVVVPECTHQGCTVGWNLGAKEWQCPCHGSRFDQAGK